MSVDTKRVQAVFLAAVDIANAAQRTAYLDRECNSDPELRQRVEALLQAHEAPASILAGPVVAPIEGAPNCTLPLDAAADPALRFMGNRAPDSDTIGVGTNEDEGPSPLEVLQPSTKPGSLGRLGHYEVLEVLGQGGFGTVVRAYDEKLHRMIAIKIMSPQLAATSPARKRFMREARSSAAIRHENVVDIHAIEEQPIPFLVMEYVAGETLQQRLDRVGPLDPLEVLRIGVQIAHGLAAAHAMGKIHRDIKPANILLENGVDRVKITDFGLARAADDASLTQSGLIAGTPMYMAPEQAQGVALDHRADLFSFGSVLYVMCSGRPPFRASTTLAVLKRVADDRPRSIREIIPEVPEWLCDFIAKLHAKNPSERFQTAQEVADLLGKYLTELQVHGKVNQESGVRGQSQESEIRGQESEGKRPRTAEAAPASTHGANPGVPQRRGRRLAVAAAVLLCLVGSLAFTEATGVTKLRSSVIRILTPDGTLVVEVDDPGVKVTVEGDGGLVITGAGLEEIRLRPGSYKVHANRDGKRLPLDRELVSIAKNGREVVKVKLEAPPTPVVAQTATGAFVLLGIKGVAERKFDTLPEAVLGAYNGDTVEIRGNGPFLTPPLQLGKRALTIRSGAGFRPVLLFAENLQTEAPLVLEGLELQRVGQKVPQGYSEALVFSTGASLHILNCRFREHLNLPCIRSMAPDCVIRNCEFLSSRLNTGASLDGKRCVIDNCLAAGGLLELYREVWRDQPDHSVQLSRCTLRSSGNLLQVHLLPGQSDKFAEKDIGRVRVDASETIFDATSVIGMYENKPFLARLKPQPEAAKALLLRMIAWRDRSNLYTPGSHLFWNSAPEGVAPEIGPQSLADWKRQWASGDGDAVEGRVKYQGGDLLAKLRATPEKLTPEDFRLRPDSAGYRAGKDGKDLGANIDFVGPGAAYERWKKAPEYQQWLIDTKQVKKAEAPKAEPKAVVLLGGKEVAERKFDTLDAAVSAAYDGDIIEVRGNGPFLTPPLHLGKRALTIRASEGFRPVIKLSPEWAEQNHAHLLYTQAALVLEGLELHRVRTGGDEKAWNHIVASENAPVRAANCRFVLKPSVAAVHAVGSPIIDLRSCEFLIGTGGKNWDLNNNAVTWSAPAGGTCRIQNCLTIGKYALSLQSESYPPKPASVVLAGNTLAGWEAPVLLMLDPTLEPPGGGAAGGYSIEASANVLDGGNDILTSYYLKPGNPPPTEAAFLRRSLSWKGDRNLFSPGSAFTAWAYPGNSAYGLKNLTEWNKFWRQDNSGCRSGKVLYRGGDLLSRADKAPEHLTPEDFRLRPDSAGYRAGKDGKDLGADIDLVGPGPAYERWKKAPEYQQWLKDSGQKK